MSPVAALIGQRGNLLHIRWSYRNFTYLGGRTLQEAATRYLLKDTTAARATRAVVSDYRRSLIPLDDAYGIRLRGQYVWDFGTGKELASWYPESETYANVFTPTKRITEQFRFAISLTESSSQKAETGLFGYTRSCNQIAPVGALYKCPVGWELHKSFISALAVALDACWSLVVA